MTDNKLAKTILFFGDNYGRFLKSEDLSRELAKRGSRSVVCEFSNKRNSFNRSDIGQMLSPYLEQSVGKFKVVGIGSSVEIAKMVAMFSETTCILAYHRRINPYELTALSRAVDADFVKALKNDLHHPNEVHHFLIDGDSEENIHHRNALDDMNECSFSEFIDFIDRCVD